MPIFRRLFLPHWTRKSHWHTMAAALLLLVIGHANPAFACLKPPPIDAELGADPAVASASAKRDRTGRVVVPVMVNEKGPFPFIVDIGANRSAIGSRLADRMALTRSGTVVVHSLAGASSVDMASLDNLRLGDLPLPATGVPIIDPKVLGTAEGLVGVDGMKNRRLTVDLERNCVDLHESAKAPRLRGYAQLNGALRFGQLIYLQGTVRGLKVNIILDTGSNVTLVNPALVKALEERGQKLSPAELGAKGRAANMPIIFQSSSLIPEIKLGRNVVFTNVAAAIDDFHVFEIWGFADTPTMLVGMDVLGLCDAISIDYARAKVYLKIGSKKPRFAAGGR